MGVTGDIVYAWCRPRQAMRRQLGFGQREDRALVFLALACGLIFFAQWPRLSREAALDPNVPYEVMIGGALLGWVFLAPLGLYALAAVSHLLALLIGGQGNWYSARLALFWSLLVASPIWLLNGLVAGLDGAIALKVLTGAVALASFLAIWLLSLYEAERGGGAL